MNDSTLPGCIGYFNKPEAPNGPCQTCKHADLCRRVIAKERLEPLLDLIADTRKTLKQG